MVKNSPQQDRQQADPALERQDDEPQKRVPKRDPRNIYLMESRQKVKVKQVPDPEAVLCDP